jgi:DNA-binding transcriptional ArsR family regulator
VVGVLGDEGVAAATRAGSFPVLFDAHRTELFDGCQTMKTAAQTAPSHKPQPDVGTIELADVLQALADPVRLEIVRQVSACPDSDPLSCGQLELSVSKSTGSHHLKILHQAGITSEREQGTRKFISLRRAELEGRFPGVLESVLRSAG